MSETPVVDLGISRAEVDSATPKPPPQPKPNPPGKTEAVLDSIAGKRPDQALARLANPVTEGAQFPEERSKLNSDTVVEDASVALLKSKYNLDAAPEVKSASDRTRARTGESVPQDPLAQITNYLDRFHEITDRQDPAYREHGLNAAKRLLRRKFVIKPEEIPESYFDNQRRLAREQGHGDIEITPEARAQLAEVIIADQESSLDKWVDYLSSPDAPYSDGLKYNTLRSVLSMGAYDKGKHAFSERTKETTAPYPDLNREALGVAIDVVIKRMNNASEYARTEHQIRQTRNKIKSLSGDLRRGNTSVHEELEAYQELLNSLRKEEDMLLGLGDIFEPREAETGDQKKLRLDDRSRLHQDIEKANFAQLYSWAIEKVTPASKEQLKTTDGKWVKYDRGSDPLPLVQSLQGYGTGWCTAGESTAEAQLQKGAFYVYYSQDSKGEPTIPRAAIRMQGDSIAEVRGVAAEQNLDGGVTPIVDEKLKEFSDGEAYQKKASDMRRLTEIDRKVKEGQELSPQELTFLYEIDSSIDGFGYEEDPRIYEIRNARNPEKDMPIIFECELTQIARNPEEINENTKAYVGPLVPGIFDKIRQFRIEHVYTSFLEGKIRFDQMTIGGRSRDELQREIKDAGIDIYKSAVEIMGSRDFTTLPTPQNIPLVRIKFADLFADYLRSPKNNGHGYRVPTYDEARSYSSTYKIFERAKELGLELCPPEVGPYYVLKYKDQLKDAFQIGMKPIDGSDGDPHIFEIALGPDGLYFGAPNANPMQQWDPRSEFIFSLPTSNATVVDSSLAEDKNRGAIEWIRQRFFPDRKAA